MVMMGRMVQSSTQRMEAQLEIFWMRSFHFENLLPLVVSLLSPPGEMSDTKRGDDFRLFNDGLLKDPLGRLFVLESMSRRA